MAEVTIIIPVSPDHVDVAGRALGSAKDQSVPCEVMMEIDHDRRGPGYMRNRMLERVTTPYVVFLDADDWIEPTFVERTLDLSRRSRKYVYTDWIEEGTGETQDRRMGPNPTQWCGWNRHLVTALIPTVWARSAGGFDENLPGMEDTDFYLKMTTRYYCGVHLNEPLLHYTNDGYRSDALRASGDFLNIKGEIDGRYTGKMGCGGGCGGGNDSDLTPEGVQLPSDIPARAKWHGNREVYGRTGRKYKRGAFPMIYWVDPEDVKAFPAQWEAVMDYPPLDPQAPMNGIEAMDLAMQMARNTAQAQPQPTYDPYAHYATPVHVDPVAHDGSAAAANVLALAGVAVPTSVAAVEVIAEPPPVETARHYSNETVFVRPREWYDSYTDLYRLIELAGYPLIYSDEVDPHSDNTYIVTTLNGSNQHGWQTEPDAKVRIILFDLEWRLDGEYPKVPGVSQLWAADQWYAKQIGAKYVTLGSDPRLNPDGDVVKDTAKVWDYALMMYRDPFRRRKVIDQLAQAGVSLAPDGWGTERHQSLMGSKAMIHIHQHDNVATVAPQRWALAAAYRLPILSERLATTPPRLPGVYVEYDQLVAQAKELRGSDKLRESADKLYERLCIKDTFRKCVERAL